MLISDKQQAANRENAAHSTGPKTDEGKQRVRLNALRYGLCACSILITGEDPVEYKQLYESLEAEWQPESPTERLYLQHLVNAQWLMIRMTIGQSEIHDNQIPFLQQLSLLERVSRIAARHERAAERAIKQLEHLKKNRATREIRPIQMLQPKTEAAYNRPPEYVMSKLPETAPLSCAPVSPDIR